MNMFCRQCEQAIGAKGCTAQGVCGKDSDTSALQDLLIHSLKGVAVYAKLARQLGVRNREVDSFIMEALFTTVTNVNFDPKRLRRIIDDSYGMKQKIKIIFLHAYSNKNKKDFFGSLPNLVNWRPANTLEALVEQGKRVGLLADTTLSEDTKSLQEILLYGLKGMAAYADHAFILGFESEEVNSFFYKALSALADNSLGAEGWFDLIIEFGKVNLRCMEILDSAHRNHFGDPVPTKVSLGIDKGPAIIVSGHDLLDLEELLKQTEDRGINIYTHGEMLPAHGYPGLKKYPHLKGHFGGAWQEQQKEFDKIPAAILMTTNCLQKPKDSYKDRIFTTGLVAYPEIDHIEKLDEKKDFSPLINKALELDGFKERAIEKEILVGFGHTTVLSLADKVIASVKKGDIKHIFLIGGCDGAKPGRNYYTEFAQKVPKDCLILTLACGKFRFNKLDFGEIGGIPRLLDCGQCNDAYSAITIASALSGALGCSINDLPLSLILSWYEQKAVCILLTLLSLGVKNIRLGPTLPPFISENILKVLIDKFNLKPTTTADKDLEEILAK